MKTNVQFGNYVVQKALTQANDKKKAELAAEVRNYADLLEASRLGKNILTKINSIQ